MGEPWYQLKAGLWHLATATSSYNLHSPFLYKLYQHVFQPAWHNADPDGIRRYRQQLGNDHQVLKKTELGNRRPASRPLKVRKEAARITIPPRYGRLMAYMLDYLGHQYVVELGTGLAVGTAYLNHGLRNTPNAQLHTLEGCADTLRVVHEHWPAMGLTDPEPTFHQGDALEQLPEVIEALPSIDLALVDANHRRSAVTAYLKTLMPAMAPTGVVILDDIHWSADMNRAWQECQADGRVRLTLDLYRLGIAFLDQSLTPTHLKLRF